MTPRNNENAQQLFVLITRKTDLSAVIKLTVAICMKCSIVKSKMNALKRGQNLREYKFSDADRNALLGRK